jgi:hypothetical protein
MELNNYDSSATKKVKKKKKVKTIMKTQRSYQIHF